MKKHILIVCMHFHPVQFRVNDIALDLINRGYKVTVVTGIPNYPQGSFNKGYGYFRKRRENYMGIDIIRIPVFPRGNNSISLILNYISFQFFGYFFQLFTRIKADHVFIYGTSPLLKALTGLRYARKRKIPSTLYVMDLWPDSVKYAGNIHNKYIINYLTKVMTKIYNMSTRILVSSLSYKDEITKLGISTDKIEFWPQYAEDIFQDNSKTNVQTEIIKDGKLNLVFAGTIAVAQGLDILVDTAKLLKKDKLPVRFNVIGDGRAKESLISNVKSNDVSDYFLFIDRKPVTEIPFYFNDSDGALLTLLDTPIWEKTIPAKLQSYMAYGIPVIASANGEVKRIIDECNCGFVSPAGNALELKESIVKLYHLDLDKRLIMCEHARAYSNKHFDKKLLMNKLEKIINT
jgi:glycosyltransferase involved in cell wall biosynthesis